MENKIFELRPIDGRKSFYGKAHIIVNDNCVYLRSYDTIVAAIDNDGFFWRLWSGYSATTMRHINAFRLFYWLPIIRKSEWIDMGVYHISDID